MDQNLRIPITNLIYSVASGSYLIMLFDLHIHTTLSHCSQLRLEQILSHASAKGLNGVCITDHHSMAGGQAVPEGVQANGLCVIFGMEYSTRAGDFLLFGPFERLRAGLSARALLEHLQRTGGVAIAAHPFRSQRQVDEDLIKEGLCSIIEGVNGRNTEEENQRVLRWQRQYQVRLVGGSDAHSLAELGRVPTRFTIRISSRADLIKALHEGSFEQVAQTAFLAA